LFIDICGDKPIYEYNSDDYEKFQLFLLKNNFNAKLILKAVVDVIIIGYANLNIKEKINFKKKIKIRNTGSTEEFNDDELSLIESKCKESLDLESLVILLLMDTGCTIKEVVGITADDIYLDSYLPFVIIRSNRFRKIHNVNKLRTVPLVGLALWALEKIKSNTKYNDFFTSKKKKTFLINKLNFKFKKIISNKNLTSFRKSFIKRLISINCPERVILDIIGQSKKNRFYSDEISLEIKASWLKQITKY
jgi:integrase